ncbi:hypothetical protein KEU06_09480 [Pseudaminobacter sp. 19-2017]|uniref:Uncharacterized protein n=1 Tax=Pseudaminobacter soli (ex Zhang et al. 2022) TaxID=2831468 RepID=A0A942E0N9_9HYPH|nr:hypothetical protein [Pseudaminobacter soli]MBS3648836.1 hypothetical protein [Pseudaminobacter soli]
MLVIIVERFPEKGVANFTGMNLPAVPRVGDLVALNETMKMVENVAWGDGLDPQVYVKDQPAEPSALNPDAAQLTGAKVLNLKMPGNDADAETIRDYLKALLKALWAEGEGFSGKRPFGNSGWEYDLYQVLEKIGFTDRAVQNAFIFEAIKAL